MQDIHEVSSPIVVREDYHISSRIHHCTYAIDCIYMHTVKVNIHRYTSRGMLRLVPIGTNNCTVQGEVLI